MVRFRGILRVCAAVIVAAAALVWQLGAGTMPAPATADLPFFVYLKSKKPEPALVAFNPSQYDPRPAQRKIPSPESVRADLEALGRAFDGLILYSYDPDVTPALLAEAKRQGFRAILLGIWKPTSEEEISGTAALVRQYQNDLALAVCIGNEGIAFNRYKLSDLNKAADRLKELLGSDIRVPVTTSEPLAQYNWVALQQFGSFLAPNIHPVWDRPELDPVKAAAWARERAKALATTARKHVLVKETGWPHGSAERFTPQTQEAFWATYVKDGHLVWVSPSVWVAHSAAFEAFRLRWKAEESKMPIEEAWGLLDTNRKPYAAFFVWQNLRKRSRD